MRGFLVGGPLLRPVHSISFHASVTSLLATITIPSTIQRDDIAVVADAIASGGSLSGSVPAGWTEIANTLSSDTQSRLACYYKRLTAADANQAITGYSNTENGGGLRGKTMLVFRPQGLLGGITVGSINSVEDDANPTTQTVTALGLPAPLIVLGVAYSISTDAVGFSTASPAFDDDVTNDHGTSEHHFGYKIYGGGSTPANHSIDMNDLGNNNHLASFYIRLR